MRIDPFVVKQHSGKVTLNSETSLGNGTVKVSATPFPSRDTKYYQVGKHGDYIQETN